MDVGKTTTVTITLTEAEARDYWIEVSEIDSLPDPIDSDFPLNTRTGLVIIRKIRDELAARGLDVKPAPYAPVPGVPPAPYTPVPGVPPAPFPAPAMTWQHRLPPVCQIPGCGCSGYAHP